MVKSPVFTDRDELAPNDKFLPSTDLPIVQCCVLYLVIFMDLKMVAFTFWALSWIEPPPNAMVVLQGVNNTTQCFLIRHKQMDLSLFFKHILVKV